MANRLRTTSDGSLAAMPLTKSAGAWLAVSTKGLTSDRAVSRMIGSSSTKERGAKTRLTSPRAWRCSSPFSDISQLRITDSTGLSWPKAADMPLPARNVGLRILSVVRAELGSLDKVVRLVKTLGMVNCTPDFTQTPAVVNGFSQVLIDVFGEAAGKAARSAVGMASLPSGVPVEVEVIFQVRG